MCILDTDKLSVWAKNIYMYKKPPMCMGPIPMVSLIHRSVGLPATHLDVRGAELFLPPEALLSPADSGIYGVVLG